MTEIEKIINHIATPMSSLFEIRKNIHNTRHFEILSNENSKLWSRNYMQKTLFLENLRPEYKLANSSNIFKRK